MSGLPNISRRSFLVMPLAIAACKPGTAVLELTGATMGTTYNVVAIDTSRSLREADIQSAINAALAEVNVQMSNWDSASEISRFNAQQSTDMVSMSPALAKVMRAAEDVHLASEGRFDTTMGPLIELWGFGANGRRFDAPEAARIADATARSGHRNTLEIGAGNMRKTQADSQVYLAAIGKGYGADRVGEALQSLGISDYMIEIGGDIFAAGMNPSGLPWQIGVETPQSFTRGVMQVVGISDLGMASSGDYRNYFEVDGERYSHVIDPTTGRPITHKTASATVLAENGMLADAWATAMLTLGREKGLEIAEQHNIAVMFIDRDPSQSEMRFTTFASSQFKAIQA